MESGRGGWLNTGVFLADYARYIGPVAEGPYTDLPGNNVAYRREAILAHAGARRHGLARHHADGLERLARIAMDVAYSLAHRPRLSRRLRRRDGDLEHLALRSFASLCAAGARHIAVLRPPHPACAAARPVACDFAVVALPDRKSVV